MGERTKFAMLGAGCKSQAHNASALSAFTAVGVPSMTIVGPVPAKACHGPGLKVLYLRVYDQCNAWNVWQLPFEQGEQGHTRRTNLSTEPVDRQSARAQTRATI
eukprot:6222650-Amphidinium_carterae.1